ncbi:MAG TPA: isoprenoid biosynthesis glyoxalase ElbB [Kiritimatiellia bacterium]|nr:isoprenoid biosynthesis glyoxalase ElbB [Kiritimatiellia bacterium]HMP00008.1 isoprenoid biosynthesis glyoxalase ElbB [Kiritimatiellia bacterium]HMP98024.1 isoprenoid biosynthesis glyoxalase ElbB [Kiritimatiellia bacterium]
MKRKKRVGVILAGCGYLDGAEIHEAVLTLLYLDQAGAEAVCFAPDMTQAHVVNHLTGQEMPDSRNVLIESARIARGNVNDIAQADPSALDALIIPGGFGAAKNLCTFAFKGAEMAVHADVTRLIEAMHKAGKPIGAWCIAPALMAKLIPGVELTIGTDPGTAATLESLGARHTHCAAGNIVIDSEKRVITTPAYMLGPWIADIAQGIERGVNEVLART